VHDHCRAISAEIQTLPGNAVIGFTKVNAKPLKQALATWASKWVYLFTHYLQDKVRDGEGADALRPSEWVPVRPLAAKAGPLAVA